MLTVLAGTHRLTLSTTGTLYLLLWVADIKGLYNDGAWHSLSVVFIGSTAQVQVDNERLLGNAGRPQLSSALAIGNYGPHLGWVADSSLRSISVAGC